MNAKDLKIGNWVLHKESNSVIVVSDVAIGGIFGGILGTDNESYFTECEVEPIEISEMYLLDFGFTKIEYEIEDCTETTYELETPNVYFNYADDWSLAIADRKGSFNRTSNYLTPDKELTNKVHLWQNLFKSLTGKDTYVREYW